jgi:L,D-transpeptidase YbiS
MDAETEIHVDVTAQRVSAVRDGKTIWEAPVSTSRHGCGEEPDSYRTPRGKHRVAEKIGDGEPIGAVFKSRRPTGEVWSPQSEKSNEDMILTRILWLAGEEPHNATSQSRYIYFHGTNQEELLGQPASHGCIRLSNRDMLKLYEYAQVGTRVMIS